MAKLISVTDIHEALDKAILAKFTYPQHLPESFIDSALGKSGLKYKFNEKTKDITIDLGNDRYIRLVWNLNKGCYSLNILMKYDGQEVLHKIPAETLIISPSLLKDFIPLLKECQKQINNVVKSLDKKRSLAIAGGKLVDTIKRCMVRENLTDISVALSKKDKNKAEVSVKIIPNLNLKIIVDKDNYKQLLPGFITTVRHARELFVGFPISIASLGTWMERYPDPFAGKCKSGEIVRKYAQFTYHELDLLSQYFKPIEDNSQLCDELRPLADFCASKGIKYGQKSFSREPFLMMLFTPRRALCYKKVDDEWCLFVMFRDYTTFDVGHRDEAGFSPYYKCSPERALEWLKAFPEDMDYMSQINETYHILGFLRFALAKEYLDDEAFLNDLVIRYNPPEDWWIQFFMWHMSETPQELIELYKFFSSEKKEKIEQFRNDLRQYTDVRIESFLPNGMEPLSLRPFPKD